MAAIAGMARSYKKPNLSPINTHRLKETRHDHPCPSPMRSLPRRCAESQ